ncbi:neuralized-like protein 2 [Lethenteron reissneri]|uniref:neuralized-like protein 2 n=1 Tax=Lethenteron reissneri TaxID=7753 RepID=UPI002AB654E2|nr:neuralized-like protein 2 [Lethenteron reissneri]
MATSAITGGSCSSSSDVDDEDDCDDFAYEKFHVVHGGNMHMDSTRTHATRVRSFGDAVCMSAQPLPPGRVFLVELSQKETGWCGHLRVGLTRLCPGGSDGLGCPVGSEQSGTRQCTHSRHGMHGPALPIPVPPHASPEMEALGGTWVVPISTGLGAQREADALLGESDGEGDIVKVGNHVIVRDSLVGRSRVGRYSHLLDPLFKTHILSTTARGTRIGVIWRILEGRYCWTQQDVAFDSQSPCISLPWTRGLHKSRANITKYPVLVKSTPALKEEGVMHLLVNGRDLGVFARGIPTHTPIFAVVDVFGCTRAVTVLHVEYAVPSLQTICRRMIQKLTVNRLAISRLGLPAALQCYCQE